MKKSVNELNECLRVVLDEVRHQRKLQNDANIALSGYNVKVGTLNEVIVDPDKLNNLSDTVLCLITIVLYELTRNDKIHPETFFNAVEITKSKQYVGDIKEKVEFPIVIENVIRVGTNYDFLTSMDIRTIVNWSESILSYNHETQRALKKNVGRSGAIISKPDVKVKSVKEIGESLKKGKYRSDVITFNILMDGDDEIEYDEKTMQLTIYKCNQIDILDGWHRIQGMSRALEENPNIDFAIGVAIKNYTIEDARSYFGQVSKTNPVPKARIKEMLNESISDMITTELVKKSDLNGKVSSSNSMSMKAGELTYFTVLSDAIEWVFKPQIKKDLLDITPFLVDFFDYLIGSYQEEFVTNVVEVGEISWINYRNVFVGYIVLAKKFYDAGKQVSHIKSVIKNIDFNKETSPLTEIFKTQGKENSKKIKKSVAAYFEQIEI